MISFIVVEQTIIPKHLAKGGIWEMTVSCGHNHETKTSAMLCYNKLKKKLKKMCSPTGVTTHNIWVQDTDKNKSELCQITT